MSLDLGNDGPTVNSAGSVVEGVTEAPTNQGTMDALSNTKGLTPDEQIFVTLAAQHYGAKGVVLNQELAEEMYGFDSSEFDALINSPMVRAALIERGLPVNKLPLVQDAPLAPRWKDAALDPLQLIVANVMLDLIDTRSQKKKLQDLGVSTRTYNMWLKDEVFMGYMRDRAEGMLGENQHEAHLALLDKVRMGDVKAIQYYNELTGRHVQERQGSTGSNVAINFQTMLVNILEIINDEVHDPQVAFAIAERFKSLLTVNSLANDLLTASTESTLVIPEVKANRQLTPRLQELMERGVGNE